MAAAMTYYNEIDPYAAQWIRNLIAAGHIPNGVVDERSIEDVTPSYLAEFTQCHFFAGIAGWPLALSLADIPADFPIWTGSCPCQPFSTAGAQAGFGDERHLWPAWQYLIAQCKPAIVVGEQVASKAADAWIDLVHADMEGMGYAFGCVPFPSAGVGAPHIRDRNYWVAHADDARLEGWGQSERGRAIELIAGTGVLAGGVADADSGRRLQAGRNPTSDRATRSDWQGNRPCDGYSHDQQLRLVRTDSPSPTNGFWHSADWLSCRDGYWRPVESGTFPLAHGISNRVGRLRAYGNAINPWQAAAFLRAAL